MSDTMYHPTTREIAARRKELAPGIHDAFVQFSRAVFADGALPEKTKQLIAVAVADVTQCPYCIDAAHATRRSARVQLLRRSWRRSGWRPRCVPGVPTRTPPLRCMRWAKPRGAKDAPRVKQADRDEK